MERKNKRVLILSIIALILVVAGASYAYFSARITGLESASTLRMTAGTLGIHYSEGDERVEVENIYPREERWLSKTITLTGNNTTDLKMNYKLGLNIETNEFKNNELSYSLTLTNTEDPNLKGTPIANKTNIGIQKATGIEWFGEGQFITGQNQVHEYLLEIFFLDNGNDQNESQGATFNASITVAEAGTGELALGKACLTSNAVSLIQNPYFTFTIKNKTNCMNWLETNKDYIESEARDTLCSGEKADIQGMQMSLATVLNPGLWQNELLDLEQADAIENVVYKTVASYTYNRDVCENIYSSGGAPQEDIEQGCSSEATRDLVAAGGAIQGEELGVLENLELVDPVYNVTNGDTYTDGDYTYTYSESSNTWNLDVLEGTNTSNLCAKVNNRNVSINIIPITYKYYGWLPKEYGATVSDTFEEGDPNNYKVILRTNGSTALYSNIDQSENNIEVCGKIGSGTVCINPNSTNLAEQCAKVGGIYDSEENKCSDEGTSHVDCSIYDINNTIYANCFYDTESNVDYTCSVNNERANCNDTTPPGYN